MWFSEMHGGVARLPSWRLSVSDVEETAGKTKGQISMEQSGGGMDTDRLQSQ